MRVGWLAGVVVGYALLLAWPFSASASSACSPVTGSAKLPHDGIVVIGEYHGTREPALLLRDLVCARLAADPEAVLLVGLELPAAFNPLWRNDDQLTLAEQLRRLRADPFWRAMMDGRHSASSLALVSWLLEQRAGNPQRLHLLGFQTPQIDEKGAELIDAQMRAQPVDQTWLFMGNAHARRVPLPGKQAATLAGSLIELGHAVVSLDIRAGSGEAWFCTPQCARFALPERPLGGERRIELQPAALGKPYDGWYYIPRLSVSEPVVASTAH